MAEEERKVLTFNTCPNCGSNRRLTNELAKSVKEKGLMKEEVELYAQVLTGIIQDMRNIALIAVGATVPAYTIHLDVCMDCGTYYAAKIIIGEARIGAIQKQPPPFSTS